MSDSYADLADAIERGASLGGDAAATGVATFEDLAHTFTVDLGPWDRMLEQLLAQLAADAGSTGRALTVLGVPTYALIEAWTRDPTTGMQASAHWLATRTRDSTPDIRLRVVKIKRGDDYSDLAESARSFRLRGDGQLDPARLCQRYTIELRRSWLHMIGDLLGQVVADAGSRERAATVLGVPQRRFARWVRWFVSRGSAQAARRTWPVAAIEQLDGAHPYADLADAVLRGALIGDVLEDRILPLHELQETYRVRLGAWDDMIGDLLSQISLDAGSLRKAAKAISMPRSTLAARLKRYQERRARPES